tara:strand:- start:32 stop:235 length:204 start_codon:yes stop_codon:yes gene_type:complete
MITITVNGQTHTVEPGFKLVDLLAMLDLTGKRLAVEQNGQIVPKSAHPTAPLHDGDKFEIVVAVGGG